MGIYVLMDHRVSLFFGNSLYLVAFGYYTVINFFGYNGAFVNDLITKFG
jgi:hypothetical protein